MYVDNSSWMILGISVYISESFQKTVNHKLLCTSCSKMYIELETYLIDDLWVSSTRCENTYEEIYKCVSRHPYGVNVTLL